MNRNGNALVTRELNSNLVRDVLKEKRTATKQQLAEATGLTAMTIAAILQQLEKNHEVTAGDQVASGGGRPALQFLFNGDYAHVLILFTHEKNGADMLYVRVVNLFGERVFGLEEELKEISLNSFEPYIEEMRNRFPTIRAIGFGLPGVERGGSIVALDYPALVGDSFMEHYRLKYGLPVVFVNDVNAAVVGYCRRKGIASPAVYLYFPKKFPPGAGIYLNGGLYCGDSNYAGEVANLPLGVDWSSTELYRSPGLFCGAVGKLTAAVCSLLNPHIVILHGSFLQEEHIKPIAAECAGFLPADAMPKLAVSGNFTLDYQTGMAQETLALIQPRLALTR